MTQTLTRNIAMCQNLDELEQQRKSEEVLSALKTVAQKGKISLFTSSFL